VTVLAAESKKEFFDEESESEEEEEERSSLTVILIDEGGIFYGRLVLFLYTLSQSPHSRLTFASGSFIPRPRRHGFLACSLTTQSKSQVPHHFDCYFHATRIVVWDYEIRTY
jgi:hypothetical protein